ncbi:hypothetical protein [Bifidobacterium platyrrhinorum]|uniref:Uncharacterized protein n=1 Tax=Bifidobacterium platyrrhinorum TaxID=2661628 RepID=A0A6L9SRV1_9BIFI|nr:hypothetical protein [Bifidobacterium platyrrhinorum]NEG55297.1 hypothetical protein [Bifidobacterium platyrrhinorum]
MAGGTVGKWDAKRGAMLGAQALAYALFIVVGAVWGVGLSGAGIVANIVALVLMVVVLAVFHWFWPFRASAVDRVIGLVVGLLSIVCVASPSVGGIIMPLDRGIEDSALKLDTYPEARWAAAVAGLLVVLTIVSFGRQMLREERSHLIRALSHCVTGGAASISLAGWYFIPYVVSGAFTASSAMFAGTVVVMVLFALVLAVASVWWLRELDPDPVQPAPWIGVAMLPFMFYGLVVFAAALLLQILG